MKHLENKQEEQKEEVNIQSLTGSPNLLIKDKLS